MNKSNLWGILFIALCMVYTGYAQEELTKEICDQKAEIILQHQEFLANYSPEVIQEMIEYITPCADLDVSRTSPKSAYAKGLLHLQNGDFGSVFGRWLELSEIYIYRAGAYGYVPAKLADIINDLSNVYITQRDVLYANTITDLNFLLNQEYKTDVVHYLLGYLKLKNLIRYPSQYTNDAQAIEAKTHFETSTHPMAKHWLAVMHYFGYGVPHDRAKGLQMLIDNDIYNSRILAQNLQNQNNDWIPIAAQERLALIENYTMLPFANTVLPDTKTTYNGYFIEFDWLAKGVKRRIPVQLTIEFIENLDDFSDKVEYEFTMNGISTKRVAKITDVNYDKYISFYNYHDRHKLEFPSLKNLLQDHPEKDSITYFTKQMSIRETTIDGKLALIGKLDGTIKIKELNEKVNTPIRLLLYPEIQGTTSIVTNSLSNSEPSSEKLDKNFATIAPNPISDQFTITYTLDQEAEVQVGVYDFFGQQRIQVPTQKSTAGTTQTITVNSSGLSSGTYIIQMTVNGAHYSKMVIKE